MRFVNTAEVTASAFDLNIRICDVDGALCGRLETAITQSLIRDCTQGVIARNVSTSTISDLSCKIRYEKCIKQDHFVNSLRSKHIVLGFPEGNIGKREIRIDVRPIEPWDASTVETMCSSWSTLPWKIVYASNGKQAGRAAGLGRPLVVSALARLRLLLASSPSPFCA